MEQIQKSGKVTRGYIGVGIQEVTPDLAKAFGVFSTEGALVGSVAPDGPGARAGLQRGDIIASLDGQPISDYGDLRLRISQMPPGTMVRLGILRSGQKRELTVTMSEYSERAVAATEATPGENAMEGVQVETLTQDMARQLNLPASARGVVITNIDPDSSAADTRLQRGDVIQELDGKAVSNLSEFQRAIREAGKKPLLVLVNRGGNTQFLVISPR
jgi:serine protease Do